MSDTVLDISIHPYIFSTIIACHGLPSPAEKDKRPRLVLVMMQSDGLCGRRKVWNLPASWKNKPCTQWLARSVSGVASQSCTYLWEELNSSLEWSENVSQRRLGTEETTLLCTLEMGEDL